MNRRICLSWGCFFISALILVGGGCGYHIQGYASLPGGVKAVHVALFENLSRESGAENIFTNAFINELLMKTDVRMAKESNATGLITGVIRSISVGALTRSSDDTVLQGRVSATLDLSMITAGGEVLWAVKGYGGNEVYTASSSNVTNEAAKKEAVIQISQRLAEKLVSAMGDQW